MTGAKDAHHHHDHDHGADACPHAQARATSAAQVVAAAEEACRTRGTRLTPIRRDVLVALLATHKPMGAYDLIEALRTETGRALAPISIYRALDFLMEQGFVHRLASRNAFVACPHAHAPHDLVAFLICETCGGVDEMSSRPLAEALSGLLAAEQFAPRHQVLEISGVCGHCRGG